MIRSQGINMNAVGKGGGRGGKGGKGVGKGKGGGVLLAKKGGPPWRGGKGLPIANATAATRKPPKPSLPEVDLFLDSQEPATAEQLRKEDRTIRKQMYGNLYDMPPMRRERIEPLQNGFRMLPSRPRDDGDLSSGDETAACTAGGLRSLDPSSPCLV
ncbi:hypothetical protein FOZ62_007099 [Perkinsus olseni]|uniref:Uncharacterized protein n=1 Tax=Perkinsus olseni TaxID=32597 RepID=A0A7J6UFV2_PEROL|nr:hypothetical protein FOZ62_007099 [Perkinsus olseni]